MWESGQVSGGWGHKQAVQEPGGAFSEDRSSENCHFVRLGCQEYPEGARSWNKVNIITL